MIAKPCTLYMLLLALPAAGCGQRAALQALEPEDEIFEALETSPDELNELDDFEDEEDYRGPDEHRDLDPADLDGTDPLGDDIDEHEEC